MIFAWNGIVPPQEWEHDPTVCDKDGMSVAIYLAKKKITPKRPRSCCYCKRTWFWQSNAFCCAKTKDC